MGVRQPRNRPLPAQVAWTKVVRHRKVAGRASPDDPALARYWATRRQRGRCPLCRGLLLFASPHDEREWEQWHTTIRKAVRKHAVATVMDLGTPGEHAAYRLIRVHCRRRIGSSPALLPGPKPSGLA